MITKERLEELIKQNATICNQYIDYNNNICYRFGKASIIQDNDEQYIQLKLNETNTSVIMYDTKYLYESKEDAEWELKFGNITRTETLKLPTWEEFITKYKTITFYKNQVKYKMYIFVKNKNTNNCRIIIYADDNSQDWFVFEELLTKENYISACKLCKKLFLGEEV